MCFFAAFFFSQWNFASGIERYHGTYWQWENQVYLAWMIISEDASLAGFITYTKVAWCTYV